jgi:release factor glutamine methyltransferase
VNRRAGELLATGGVFAMEHDETQDVRPLFPSEVWTEVIDRDDLTGRPRFVTARRVRRTADCGRM